MAKVLVIDDEEGIRHLVDTLLRWKGYDVVLAAGGRKGFELFRRECPDVVVLDLNMPEIRGVAVLRQIRRLKPDQPVIVLTAAGTPEKEQQVHALGVNEFIEKEFSLHRLGDALTRLLKPPVSAIEELCGRLSQRRRNCRPLLIHQEATSCSTERPMPT